MAGPAAPRRPNGVSPKLPGSTSLERLHGQGTGSGGGEAKPARVTLGQ